MFGIVIYHLFFQYRLALIPPRICNHIWNYLTIPKRQRLYRWISGIDNLFHSTLHNKCNHLSMLGYKLIHVSKRGPSCLILRDSLARNINSHDTYITKSASVTLSAETKTLTFKTAPWSDIGSRLGLLMCNTLMEFSCFLRGFCHAKLCPCFEMKVTKLVYIFACDMYDILPQTF